MFDRRWLHCNLAVDAANWLAHTEEISEEVAETGLWIKQTNKQTSEDQRRREKSAPRLFHSRPSSVQAEEVPTSD